jgi:hypothetical protein
MCWACLFFPRLTSEAACDQVCFAQCPVVGSPLSSGVTLGLISRSVRIAALAHPGTFGSSVMGPIERNANQECAEPLASTLTAHVAKGKIEGRKRRLQHEF